MAAGLSEAQLAARVMQKLLNLKCPFLEGISMNDSDAVIRLLCTPGVDRLQILEWLCISCYPPLERKFAELRFHSMQDYGTDLVIKKMTWLGHNLGVCSAEDFDLFLGQASPYRQLVMMDKMLGGLQQYKQITAAASTDLKNISSVHSWNSQLLIEVRNDPHLRSSANLEFNLSLDAHRLLKRVEANFESRGRKKCSPPSINSMEKLLIKLSEELKETNEHLEEMKKTVVFLGPTESSDTTFQTLKLTLSDFHQLMTVFSLTFEHEFGVHCNKAPPQLCNFGTLCKTVHKLLTSCIDELAALAEISVTCRELETIVNGLQQDVINWEGGEAATLPVRVKEMKKKYTEFLEVFRSHA
ncbi:HAUS augmin-like complex subunit 7 isoform X1 [Carcharodon carcharias]|uniref:HAUS augmin-like complex subunit 7 isoform X1 n=2 Tax=Carcharodon carcharias TaxID=13397 RepID=UPI001B7EDA88|nr:HAUS augmin-like complex subunit 7 isoform X1 [Carcharodon carcharias]